jgi:hypothetical protein
VIAVKRHCKKANNCVWIIVSVLLFFVFIFVVANSRDYEAEVIEYINKVGLVEVTVTQGKGYEHYIKLPSSIHRQTMVDYVIKNINNIPPHKLQPGDYIVIPRPYFEED